MSRPTLGDLELLQAAFTGFDYPQRAQLVRLLGDGVTPGNVVLQGSAPTARQAGVGFTVADPDDVETVRGYYEGLEVVTYTEHNGTEHSVQVTTFAAQERVGDVWDVTVTLVEAIPVDDPDPEPEPTIKYTPLTMVMGDPGPNILWEGDVDTEQDVVVQVWETPAATGDYMLLRFVVAGLADLDVAITPKDAGWTDTGTMRFAGDPVEEMRTTDNSGFLPAAGTKHLSIYLYMGNDDNPTTYTMADISVQQGGVEVT